MMFGMTNRSMKYKDRRIRATVRPVLMSLFQAITASLDSVIDIPTLVLGLSQPDDFTGIRCFHF